MPRKNRYTILDVKTEDLMWLAGWIEGEGTFVSYQDGGKDTCRIVSTCMDYDVVARAADIFGTNPWSYQQGKYWRVGVAGVVALVWMLRLLPHMGERRGKRIKQILVGAPIGKVKEALQLLTRGEEPIT